jgi:hypothetical protein
VAGSPSDINDSLREAPLFDASFAAVVVIALSVVVLAALIVA